MRKEKIRKGMERASPCPFLYQYRFNQYTKCTLSTHNVLPGEPINAPPKLEVN